MKDAAGASTLRPLGLPGARFRMRLGATLRRRPMDGLSIALILLLAATWLSEGAASLTGVSSGAAGKAVDLGEAVIGLWLAGRLVRDRRIRVLVPLAVYALWVATGLINSHAAAGPSLTALRNWLLVPAMACLLAVDGSSERRARGIMAALAALTAFEFLLTLVQLVVVAHATRYSDLIVGSFGTNQNAVLGVAILLLGCLAAAGYLVGATYGRWALLLGVVLPLASSWVVVKFATILLPVVVVITAVTALALGRTIRRRALIAVGAAILSSVAVVGSYALFKPSSFSAINPLGSLGNYLSYGSVRGSRVRAQIDGTVLGPYWNAQVVTARLPAGPQIPRIRGFLITSLNDGDYTASMARLGSPILPAIAGRPYRFTVSAANGSTVAQNAIAEIEWRDRHLHILGDSIGPSVAWSGRDRWPAALVATGFAPAGAAFAVPKLAITSHPPAGSSTYAWSPKLRLTGSTAVAGPRRAALGGTVLGASFNAGIRTQPLPAPRAASPAPQAFRVTSRGRGAYSAALIRQRGAPLRTTPGQAYSFTALVGNPSSAEQQVALQIEWLKPTATRPPRVARVGEMVGARRAVGPSRTLSTRMSIGGVAPPGAQYAVPTITVSGPRGAPSSVLISAPTLRQVAKGQATSRYRPTHRPSPSRAGSVAPSRRPAHGSGGGEPTSASRAPGGGRQRPPSRSHPSSGRRQPSAAGGGAPGARVEVGVLPGHLTLLKTAIRGLSGSITSELFGFGLGEAQLPEGVFDTAHITPREAGSQSDAGTLVIERGWLGVAVVALLAIFLGIAAIRLTARAPNGQWTTAFRVAVPGALVGMAAYAVLGAMLQNHSAAIAFWLILGLGLSLRTPGEKAEGTRTSSADASIDA